MKVTIEVERWPGGRQHIATICGRSHHREVDWYLFTELPFCPSSGEGKNVSPLQQPIVCPRWAEVFRLSIQIGKETHQQLSSLPSIGKVMCGSLVK